MTWSKWRGAMAVTLLASVGLAWSQSPMNRPGTTSERIMTVHENGKELRCRVVQSWRTSTGAQAHQLQVLTTGELLTIVEDGSPTTVPGSTTRALPTRIFHWGQRNRVSPAGAPLPPETIEPAVATTAEPTIKTTSGQTITTAPTVISSPTPAAGIPCDNCIVGRGQHVIGCPDSKERIIAWEEGTGRQVSYPSGNLIVQNGSSKSPVIIEGSQPIVLSEQIISETTPRTGLPRLFQPRTTPGAVVSERVIQPSATTSASRTTVLPSEGVDIKSATPPATFREKVTSAFTKSSVNKPAEPRPVDAKAPTELPAKAKKDEKLPFSSATAQSQPTPKTSPLAIPAKSADKVAAQETKTDAKDTVAKEAAAKDSAKKDFRAMWGKDADSKIEQPGLATVEREKVRKDVPPASQTEKKKQDILLAPERFNPASEKANPKTTAELTNLGAMQMAQQPNFVPQPLGVQSVLSARNGAQGPVQYIPVPVATVPEPIRPPTPPEPTLPQPPNPTGYANAFSPPMPQGQQPQLTPEQMQVIMKHQALMQQQAYLQQLAMQQRMQNAGAVQLIPVGYGPPMQANYPAVYGGPQAPNPVVNQQPIQQMGFTQQAAGAVNAMDRRVVPAAAQQQAASDSSTLAQLINVLQESQYPAQREWAATNLSTFDYRVYPQLPQVLVQAARQDSAPTVRAAAIYSLSRLNVQTEPVLGTLQALRGDADPRVRQEVEQAYLRMGMAPPQQ